MKDNRTSSFAVGALLVALGALFLLQNFIFANIANFVWLVLFGLGGLVFLYVFAVNQQQWWALIPGFTLLGLAVLIGFGDKLGDTAPGVFLGSIGLAFWVIFFVRREFWWALIPAGVLTTLAFVAAFASRVSGFAAGGIFFLGLAGTFCLVYLLSGAETRQRWALIPAGILGVLGILLTLSLGGLVNYLWALVLVGAGVFLLSRARPIRR